ncbi:MAG: hypothetical protein UY27_C0019G0007 [Candidatus Gottesmanbacteria bacterium GW2011_GWA1_48_13]|uniref:Uncharacterized protein n=1 Tax=Candidatus Gottesmanbacteria bacterium GW2011_GWA1_48_13 TaxID=1618439 RepID=A0A0G1XM25_9BACT|nr:MAG: hypothetical protein UY27_C0019G0007 [Candidatus Gottesmanbacteria bacterium GW2011_GWA1_48_13]
MDRVFESPVVGSGETDEALNEIMQRFQDRFADISGNKGKVYLAMIPSSVKTIDASELEVMQRDKVTPNEDDYYWPGDVLFVRNVNGKDGVAFVTARSREDTRVRWGFLSEDQILGLAEKVITQTTREETEVNYTNGETVNLNWAYVDIAKNNGAPFTVENLLEVLEKAYSGKDTEKAIKNAVKN